MQTLRLALRRHLRAPGFAAAAILTIGLAVGSTTAIFSVVDGVLLRPLPLPEPERLAFITREGDVSLPDAVDWRARSRSFDEFALFLRAWAFDLTGQGEPQRLRGVVAEHQYFAVLGVPALLGRTFGPDDDRPGAPATVLISEGLWRRQFGAAPDVVGRTLTLSDRPATVLGVMPERTDFLHDGVDLYGPASVWVPWAVGERGTNNFDAIGRLASGVAVEQARAEMVAITTDLARQYPRTNRTKIVEPIGALEFLVGGVRKGLWLLLAAVALVLVIGAVNLASLLLAGSVARREEFAVRISLGASQRRLVAQLLAEGLGLALAGGLLGVLLAELSTAALLRALPSGLPRVAELAVDGRALAVGLVGALLAGALFSLPPALHLLRGDLSAFLRGARSGGSAGRQRLFAGLVVSEVALATLLLIGAGLLLRTFERLDRVPLGFAAEQVFAAAVVLPESRYGQADAQSRAFAAIVERLRAQPGIEEAAYVTTPPLEPRGGVGGALLIEDRPVPAGEEPGVRWRPVLGDYFATLRLPIVKGRAFTEADGPAAERVAIVNEAFARRHWPDQDPLGRRLAWRDFAAGGRRWMTVIGVASDVRSRGLAEPDVPALYTPYLQRDPQWIRFGSLVARSSLAPEAFRKALGAALWALDPTLPLERVEALEARRADLLAPQRAATVVTGAFSSAALLLALQGLYGLLAYAVAQRRREVGIRMALGAGRGQVLRHVLARGLWPGAVGLLLGLGGAAAGGSLLADVLFEVPPLDLPTFAGVALLVLGTATAACIVPARRAARLHPAEALRSE